MKARTVGVTVALAAGLGLGGTAQAALYDRGGGLIYDSVLNITWLQDANHAVGDLSRPGRIANIIANVGTVAGHTLVAADFDAFTGQMTWWGAVAWADELEYRDVLRGVVWDDWRLPVTRPLDGVNYRIGPNIYDGTSDFGYNVSAEGTVYSQSTASELASLFYRSDGLHGISYCSTQGVCPSTDWYQKFPLSDLFVALQYGAYWSSPEYPAGVGYEKWTPNLGQCRK